MFASGPLCANGEGRNDAMVEGFSVSNPETDGFLAQRSKNPNPLCY